MSANTENLRYEDAFDEILEYELSEHSISIRLTNFGNAFERFMIAFSTYRKETRYDERQQVCNVKLWYSKNDKKDVMRKLRSK